MLPFAPAARSESITLDRTTGRPVSNAPVVVWFRLDLRLADNLALIAAATSGRPVIPAGLMDDYNQVAVRDYMIAYSGGWQSQVTNTVQQLTGKRPRSIAEFARQYAAAFGKR